MQNPIIDKEKLIRDLLLQHKEFTQNALDKYHERQSQCPDDPGYAIPDSLHRYSEMFLSQVKDIISTI